MFIYFIHHQTSNNGNGGLISKKLFDFGQTEYAKSLPREEIQISLPFH